MVSERYAHKTSLAMKIVWASTELPRLRKITCLKARCSEIPASSTVNDWSGDRYVWCQPRRILVQNN